MKDSFDGAATLKDTALEIPRVLIEGGMYLTPALQAFQYVTAPRGQGAPVLLLPGFGGHDSTLWPLGIVMKAKGHDPYDWKQGVNLGPKHIPIEEAEAVLHKIYDQTEKKVTLVGQSLGGAYAMALASRNPDKVERLITLGSPINPNILSKIDELISYPVRAFFEGLNPPDHPQVQEFMMAAMKFVWRQHELGIPSTSIYSRGDGIVGVAAAINPNESPIAENIQVRGSHVGMALHPITQGVILNRAAQKPGEHEPLDFKRSWKLLPQEPLHLKPGSRVSRTLENNDLVVA